MLTDQQIEAAARKLCELRGIDPDEMVSHGADPSRSGAVLAILRHSPNWKLVAAEIRAADQVREAIASVEPMGALERIDPAQYQRIKEVVTNAASFCPSPGPCGHCGHEHEGHYPQGA